MSAGVTSERVYGALKSSLLSGHILPGERLEPRSYAEALQTSATPVRDALHRLVGEYLVEMRPAEGFLVPAMTDSGLRSLYTWHLDLSLLIVRRWPGDLRPKMPDLTGTDYADRARRLFTTMAVYSGDIELVRQAAAASDRLATARVAEARILADADRDLRGLATLINAADTNKIAHWLEHYHQNRINLIGQIIRASISIF
ncbi:MAG: hypothetical protein BGN95_08275 [Sphingomonas sp. 66-10]|uniref:GntR family transcriptional regulator n=1 Tax=Sphingomonas sp. 66-10 TaxID=1895848 RepID=UPI00092C2B5A|nr:GntR family transcriptional regulator [Sphingomonas sp. 66-10]OJU23299.1 MAG: hypothetical protein BGN95_08275 [Sphingomonas sp. 66-10]